ncbi:Heavy metal tolerance protein [Venturia nashicola]|uniref:Heavy metal tolerance protein n=1 Tax=Venturia nashicola TaxID=86259 RepID=A0A4Z1NUA1_9PEZI|nr:Heavy metal tolerance protein [Venturia nashicola]TLD29998.1 Heavy metal tolerance protein [Venturia nashicola]
MPFSLKRRSVAASAGDVNEDMKPKPGSRRNSLLALLKGRWRMGIKSENNADENSTPFTNGQPTRQVPAAQKQRKEEEAIGNTYLQADGATAKADSALPTPSSGPSATATVVQQLNEDDVQKLFSWAPQFSITTIDGQLQPAASFPWDNAIKATAAIDAPLLEHTFSACTLRKHVHSRLIESDPGKKAMTYDTGVFETPSMLSARGNELGTVGFDHFLQESVADSLQPHYTDQEVSEEDNFELLQENPEKLGIRRFDLATVAERLAELSDVYKAAESGATPNLLVHQPSAELYTFLFGKFLTPPKFDSSTEDPTGLKVQIETLIKILTIKGIWYDFSKVEWRIRLGQILWSDVLDTELSASLVDLNDAFTERNVLLLQLLLSCELLARLDAITSLSTEKVKNELHLTLDEVNKFRDLETQKSKWDLVFSRRFLENVDARSVTTSKEVLQEEPEKRGFFFSAPAIQEAVKIDHVDVMFLPRKSSQQLKGLFHFARAIGWPNPDRFENKLTETLLISDEAFSIPSPSVYATPLSTPRSVRSARSSSYFETRPGFERQATGRSLQLQPPSPTMTPSQMSPDGTPSTNPTHPTPKALIGGWLTRSYLTGLVLPGEPLSHFLISALLENDAAAIAALGDSANLYGGFVYKQRSWWSKGSIVGRVLACLSGATECMGWIALPCVPQGFHAGWLDVEADAPEFHAETPRIQQGEKITADSTFLASKRPAEVRPSDLTLPRDAETTPKKSMWFDGLRLEPAQAAPEAGVYEHYTATLQFSASSIRNELGHCVLPLQCLVQFISAYPCTPPPRDQLFILHSADQKQTIATAVLAHPLHVEQSYETIEATEVLAPAFVFPTRLEDKAGEKHVYILDARDDPTLELIARGWCSSRGENAIVSRVGVTCLACSVREARALSVRVVIRVGI